MQSIDAGKGAGKEGAEQTCPCQAVIHPAANHTCPPRFIGIHHGKLKIGDGQSAPPASFGLLPYSFGKS